MSRWNGDGNYFNCWAQWNWSYKNVDAIWHNEVCNFRRDSDFDEMILNHALVSVGGPECRVQTLGCPQLSGNCHIPGAQFKRRTDWV